MFFRFPGSQTYTLRFDLAPRIREAGKAREGLTSEGRIWYNVPAEPWNLRLRKGLNKMNEKVEVISSRIGDSKTKYRVNSMVNITSLEVENNERVRVGEYISEDILDQIQATWVSEGEDVKRTLVVKAGR